VSFAATRERRRLLLAKTELSAGESPRKQGGEGGAEALVPFPPTSPQDIISETSSHFVVEGGRAEGRASGVGDGLQVDVHCAVAAGAADESGAGLVALDHDGVRGRSAGVQGAAHVEGAREVRQVALVQTAIGQSWSRGRIHVIRRLDDVRLTDERPQLSDYGALGIFRPGRTQGTDVVEVEVAGRGEKSSLPAVFSF